MGTTRINGSTSTRRILVTGGAGFLGSHLCEHLLRLGNAVFCLDNFQTGSSVNVERLAGSDRFEMIEQDVGDALPASLTVDGIFNLACAASPPRYQADPVHTLMTSVIGTRNLLDLAERCDAVLVQASTSEIYGDPEVHPQNEDYWGHVNPTGPRACYDEGKRAAETLCFDYLRLGRADARVARIFNTYGPRMRRDDGRIVSNLIGQALERQPLTIYGDGKQTRSFCYVSDLIDGLMALMALPRNPNAPINLGNPNEVSINALATLILDLVGTRASIDYRPRPVDDPMRRRPDISRAKQLLNWQPRRSLRRGLAATIDWFASRDLANAAHASTQTTRGSAADTGLLATARP
ncbi:UDP-glucuronic acid decarboxylase family protein [Marinivivus vitaminiproducens]|uniref:UDP-glucuronic acid decarboxylase family protein n=1 Tax=Marinivivus vitaminiproducens TaxID=3035935 RepID=UPI00279D991F|nr:SDR family oxidoreductase [Geminicoccaceae bacterium SCSIO 64248]